MGYIAMHIDKINFVRRTAGLICFLSVVLRRPQRITIV